MRTRLALMYATFLVLTPAAWSDSVLIRGGTVVDGTGEKPRRADVRIVNDRIAEVGRLQPRDAEKVFDATGLTVAPGFIDAHSHAGFSPTPHSLLVVSQGITTAVIGQDGGHSFPLSSSIAAFAKNPTPYNVASFAGHGTLRRQVMGAEFKRKAKSEEVDRMAALVAQEMAAGALGLSSGLEYDPGFYASTYELVTCAQAAARAGGIYISHLRNEDNRMLEALDELIRIAREANCSAQVSHIKLGSKSVWGNAAAVLRRMEWARREGLDVTADVYPYLFWQSSITVLIPTRDWSDRAAWQTGLDDVGGPDRVLLAAYSHDAAWAGKTIAQISQNTGKDPVTVIQEIVAKVHGPGGSGAESVVVTAMQEDDLRAFLREPNVMICSDGAPGGTHPRAAGTYPRVLGRYVREEKVLTLQEAVRKMTSLPAKRMGFADRGTIKPGLKADLVVFDADTIIDRATTSQPTLPSEGVRHVFVNGTAVLVDGKPTDAAPGRFLLRAK